jgi:predicted PurR-regulated permease PerM
MLTASRGPNWVKALLVPLTILSWLALLIVTTWLLSHVAKALLTLVLAALLAFAANPIVNWLERRMPRVLAVSITFVGGALVMIGLLTVVVVAAVGQVQQLVHNLPSYSARAQGLQPRLLNLLEHFGISSSQLNTLRENLVGYVQTIGTRAASGAFDLAAGLANLIIEMVLILILGIYLTANSGRITQWLREQAPAGQKGRAEMTISIVNRVVGGYIRGTLVMALFIGTLVGLGMQIIGVPYAALLGVLAFFMEFIPVIGVFISGAACAAVAVTQSPVLALVVLGYFVVVHIIEGDVVGPRVMGKAIGVHPAVSLLALVAGGEVLGLWGALFGAPIAGLIQSAAAAVWHEIHGGTRTEPPAAPAPVPLPGEPLPTDRGASDRRRRRPAASSGEEQ